MESSQALPPALSILEHGVREDFYHDDPVQDKTGRKFHGKFLTTAVVIFASVFFFQSTLASNISLNSSQGIEFGQGVSQAVACSESQNVTVTPRSSFVNATNGTGTYYLGSITVANIPTSCYGVNFKLSAFGPSSSTPLALFNSTSTEAVVYNNSGSFEVRPLGSAFSISGGSGTFTITFDTPVAEANSVSKVTIQSASGQAVQLGETGPGGGVIFYKASTPFTCGPTRAATCSYLEAAPNGWQGAGATDDRNPDTSRTWSPTGQRSNVIAAEEGIGWGYKHSVTIAALAGSDTTNSAATLARSYSVTVGSTVYNDWFLPSKDELNEMYLQKSMIGLSEASYYSSTDNTNIDGETRAAYSQSMQNGAVISDAYKFYSDVVRPIRAF
jgi:hypothetical protein